MHREELSLMEPKGKNLRVFYDTEHDLTAVGLSITDHMESLL